MDSPARAMTRLPKPGVTKPPMLPASNAMEGVLVVRPSPNRSRTARLETI